MVSSAHNLEKIRLSIGSASVLGLKKVKVDTDPTTCYMMTFTEEDCIGQCGFCPQGCSVSANHRERLSRVQWPIFSWNNFLDQMNRIQFQKEKPKFSRLCIQVLNYSGFFEDVLWILENLHKNFPTLPISAAIPPISTEKMQLLHNAGLERIAFALDACTQELFFKIKGKGAGGPYYWNEHWEKLQNAIKIFGNGYVTTHFIVGLGESEQEMIYALQHVIQMKILPGIFLFTPVKGTPMGNASRPVITVFRHIQIARYLLLLSLINLERFVFSNGSLQKIRNLSSAELKSIIHKGIAFKTAGCPSCNRPYYTSSPGEEPDGFPRDLTKDEEERIFIELSPLIDE